MLSLKTFYFLRKKLNNKQIKCNSKKNVGNFPKISEPEKIQKKTQNVAPFDFQLKRTSDGREIITKSATILQ